MAAGVEARVPFLDRRVIEAANALNDSCCLHPVSFETKRVLKLMLRKYLPHNLVYRRKIGFDLPIAAWLRTQFRPTVEQFLSEKVIPAMNYSFWARLYAEHSRDRTAPRPCGPGLCWSAGIAFGGKVNPGRWAEAIRGRTAYACCRSPVPRAKTDCRTP